jgi:DNA invertase Pin-like site-specific DNA recombinase
MKVAVYTRVSRTDLNSDNQLVAITEFCKTKNYEIYDIYSDVISGKIENRPELNRLYEDSKKGLFQAVIIWKLDRLGRSLQQLIYTVNYFKGNNIDLICITQDLDTTTSGGKLLFHIFGAIAEFERTLISERTKAGLERVRREGIRKIGRPKGSLDKKIRSTKGYFERYIRRDREIEQKALKTA